MIERAITDSDERDAYLKRHLPYRINSLLAYDLMLERKRQAGASLPTSHPYNDSLLVEPMFEISLVFARSLLQFLGVDVDNAGEFKLPVRRKDDISIKSLFPQRDYCSHDDSELLSHKPALVVLLRSANKSVAHLTTLVNVDVDQGLFSEARLTTYRLMLKYLPEIDSSKIWWHTQVEHRK